LTFASLGLLLALAIAYISIDILLDGAVTRLISGEAGDVPPVLHRVAPARPSPDQRPGRASEGASGAA
jgi:hypothetical protein